MRAHQDFLIAPSLLSADFANLQTEISAVTRAGADWLHVDVMDGQFVPNLTIGAPVVKALRKVTELPLDVHLMIVEPERHIDDFIAAGSHHITIHIEASLDPATTLKKIRFHGVKAGLTLRPTTPIEDIFPFLLLVDVVLIMTVNPGFGGQTFMVEQVGKIRAVRKELSRLQHKAWIVVDGGINPETARFVREADVLVAGHYIFKNDYAEAIRTLKEAGR